MDNRNPNISTLANRYLLQTVLGSGGMAVVYKAWDSHLERPVAIKILRQDFSGDPALSEQFKLEAKAAANLSHPNIITVHDFGFDNGRLFIVMEYVPGIELKSIIKTRGRFPVDETISLMVQACAGLGYAHRAGLIHCDIKPQNMLVTPDGRLKITDFGIARALATIHPDEQNDVVWGSPQYFAPEQATGTAPSPASDVYSLGVIIYEMLTGRLPFISEDPNELARLHRENNPAPPRQFNPVIPVALEQIILKVLSKEPANRYRTADQLGRILMNFSTMSETNPGGIPVASSQAVGSQNAATATIPNATPAHRQPRPQKPDEMVVDSEQEEKTTGNDWGTIALSLVTFLLVGGLIPWWLYVWFTLNPPR